MKVLSKVSQEDFELQFLSAEWYKDVYDEVRERFDRLITRPDITNCQENLLRKELLWKWRYPLLGRLPLEIEWQTISLDIDEFENLLVIREIGWENTFGIGKNLREVAQAIKDNVEDKGGVRFDIVEDIKGNIGKYEFNEKLILIASGLQPPLTIVEGNHRAVAFELKSIESGETKHIPTEFLLGVSPEMIKSPWLNFRLQ